MGFGGGSFRSFSFGRLFWMVPVLMGEQDFMDNYGFEVQKKRKRILKAISDLVFRSGDSTSHDVLSLMDDARSFGVSDADLNKVISKAKKDFKRLFAIKKENHRKQVLKKLLDGKPVDLSSFDGMFSESEWAAICNEADRLAESNKKQERRLALSNIRRKAEEGNTYALAEAIEKAKFLGVSRDLVEAEKVAGASVRIHALRRQEGNLAYQIGYRHGLQPDSPEFSQAEIQKMSSDLDYLLGMYSNGEKKAKQELSNYLGKVNSRFAKEWYNVFIYKGVSNALVDVTQKYADQGVALGLAEF